MPITDSLSFWPDGQGSMGSEHHTTSVLFYHIRSTTGEKRLRRSSLLGQCRGKRGSYLWTIAKGERVLRSEAIIHNTKALPIKRSPPYFQDIVTELEQILVRFLDALHCVVWTSPFCLMASCINWNNLASLATEKFLASIFPSRDCEL